MDITSKDSRPLRILRMAHRFQFPVAGDECKRHIFGKMVDNNVPFVQAFWRYVPYCQLWELWSFNDISLLKIYAFQDKIY